MDAKKDPRPENPNIRHDRRPLQNKDYSVSKNVLNWTLLWIESVLAVFVSVHVQLIHTIKFSTGLSALQCNHLLTSSPDKNCTL